jgi:hypothetical protein
VTLPAFAWRPIALDGMVRVVRVAVANPNGDPQRGGLAEVQIWP